MRFREFRKREDWAERDHPATRGSPLWGVDAIMAKIPVFARKRPPTEISLSLNLAMTHGKDATDNWHPVKPDPHINAWIDER